MPIEMYRERIAPHLDLFDLVYLQGWGEPMLHPHLWEMLQLARGKGCRTGFTTNGAWLYGDLNLRIVDLEVDLISVSFAGTGAPVHEALRTNSKFNELCRNFESLAELKSRTNHHKPWLEIHFLMTRRNMAEFPALVELGSKIGADEVVATNLAYAPSPGLDRMRIFDEQPLDSDLEIIERAETTAYRLGIPLRVYPIKTQPETLVCDADPVNSIYINHKGEVSACVYLGLTVDGQIPRYFQGDEHPFDCLSFGNVQEGLGHVLKSRKRQEFTKAFRRRNVSADPLAMFAMMAGEQNPSEIPAPPEPCRYCYKMLGI
jgi:MoaA/NifB/PqqE/SkfB family radical SAM enzyme